MTVSAGMEADAWGPTPPSASVLQASLGFYVNLVGFLPGPWLSLAGSLGLSRWGWGDTFVKKVPGKMSGH